MKKWIFLLVCVAVLTAGGILGYMYLMAPPASRVTVFDARINDVKAMVRLCSMDIYEDMPVKGGVGTRHLFGRATYMGSISFDLDSLQVEERGDTVLMTLPREIVEIYESTDPGSYIVIDTWNDRFLGSSKFTNAEENAIKLKARDEFRSRIYAKGYVRQARAEAVDNLTEMMTALYRRPVLVIDPTPSGTP